jgi:hypothetical protein
MTQPIASVALLLRLLAMVGVSLFATGATATEIQWKYRAVHGTVSLMANPLGAASRLSFYEGRGFATSEIQPYAKACGFSFGMLNEGSGAIVTELKSWRAIGADGKEIRFRLPEEWEADWRKANLSEPARIAFRWAQFQSDNTFEPGDWIMGMATLTAAPKSPFNIIARFTDTKGEHELHLDKLYCADD